MRTLASIFVVLALGRAAAADDGPRVATKLDASMAVGPLPADDVFDRLDAAVGATMWHRLHVGIGGAVGSGGQASFVGEAYGEVGLWLHASANVDLLIGWRLGRARLTIHDMPVTATMTASLFEVRVHLRPRVDLVVAPFTLTGYYSGLWAFLAGPSVGIAVPW
jgi:hypothetical protein